METERVNLADVGTNTKEFGELYRLLTVEGRLYLSPVEYTNMNFISDISFQERKVGINISNYLFLNT